ncbi:MAG: hypothetical protein ACOCQG_06380 [Candidatus Nanoarchaeia archaeon]
MKNKKMLIKDEETREILMWLGIFIGLVVVTYLLVGFGDVLWAFSGSEADIAGAGTAGGGCPTGF